MHLRRGWNPENDVPLRHRGIIQFIFIFQYKIYVRHRPDTNTLPPYSPCCWGQTKEKNIPVDSHQLALQDNTIPGPHRRTGLQSFLPSSTHSQRPFQWNFVTRYVWYVHKHTTFQIQKVPNHTPRKKNTVEKGYICTRKKKFANLQPLRFQGFYHTPVSKASILETKQEHSQRPLAHARRECWNQRWEYSSRNSSSITRWEYSSRNSSSITRAPVMERCRQIFSSPFCREGEMAETLAC